MGPKFNADIFHFNQPMVMANGRGSASLLPIVLRYHADGYEAGTVLARNTTDGLYQRYVDGTGSGIGDAACVLFFPVPVEDFGGATGTQGAVGIFGRCDLYLDKLVGYDAAAKADLGGREITDGSGTALFQF